MSCMRSKVQKVQWKQKKALAESSLSSWQQDFSLRETFVLSSRTKFLLLLPENSGNETIVNRYNIGEAGRVGEQLQNILPPWSSSPNTFQLRRMKRFPFPLTSAAFAGVMHFRIRLQ